MSIEQKINELLEEVSKEIMTDKHTKSKLESALKEDAKISMESKKGNVSVSIEGSRLTLIMLLAGLEKTVLEKTKTPESFFQAIKKIIGTKED